MTVITPSAYPRRPNPRGVADAEIMAGNDFTDLAKAINEAWTFCTPPLIHDTFETEDDFLTSSHTYTHRYRFHTPWGLGVDWSPQAEVWLYRSRPTTSGTWEVDLVLNSVNQGTYTIPDETAEPAKLIKLDSLVLDETVDTHTFEILQTTYSGLNPSSDFASSLLVITERDDVMTLVPDTLGGVPFPRGIAFLPTDTELGVNQSVPVHMLVDMRSTLLDIFHYRQPALITRSRAINGPQTFRWLFDIPPLVSEIRAQLRLFDTSAGANTSEAELIIDGETWNPGQAPQPSAAWFTHDFELSSAGPRRSVLVTLEAIGDVQIQSICVYCLPVE